MRVRAPRLDQFFLALRTRFTARDVSTVLGVIGRTAVRTNRRIVAKEDAAAPSTPPIAWSKSGLDLAASQESRG